MRHPEQRHAPLPTRPPRTNETLKDEKKIPLAVPGLFGLSLDFAR